MSGSVEKSCTMLVHFDKPASANELKEAFEGNDSEAKVVAMKKLVISMLNGEQLPGLFITIVRYVLPCDDHNVQKLLLLYLETIEKTSPDGKILPEMILICQNLRNNLQHPNEFLRGQTLRFLCKIYEDEILEPLVPSVLANLEHRHSYVRKNAILAVNAIYKLPKGEHMIPDAPDIVENFLQQEQDISARRNALVMLTAHAPEKAMDWLLANLDSIAEHGDILQVAILDLVRKVARSDPKQKGKCMKIIIALMQSKSTAVTYECAVTLTHLSQAPTAVQAACQCFCQLLISQSDNNVKLIVLDRLKELKEKQLEVMQDSIMDILRALSSPNLDIRAKTLELALELVDKRNIDEVVMVLKKEVVKTQNADSGEKQGEYRQLLVQSIHSCAVRFPDVAGSVVYVLMDFMGDSNTASALDVVFFVREIVETNPKLRDEILQHLMNTFYQIRSSRVCTCALWIIGEYAAQKDHIGAAIDVIKSGLGPLPFFSDSEVDEEGESASQKDTSAPAVVRPAVLSDGTYASQAAVTSLQSNVSSVPNLRALLLTGDFFLGAVISSTYTKLLLRLREIVRKTGCMTVAELNMACVDAMLYIAGMLRLGESDKVPHPIDSDSRERIGQCLSLLGSPVDEEMLQAWLEGCRASFTEMTAEKQALEGEASKSDSQVVNSQVDEQIDFPHLRLKKGMSQVEIEAQAENDLATATGLGSSGAEEHALNRIIQLTGFSDPVFAEAYVTVHQYDIVLDVTVSNRTQETLQNLCLELATMGDLKLVERPQNYALGPGATKAIRANIKVSSTETGVIFGNIVYDAAGHLDRNVVVLNDIHIDIMDYISPATCADVAFRNMWAEFEWENKVAVNTAIDDVNKFLDHIIASTNMKCLTPPSALSGDCGYLAANLYAKSVFGEDALVNLSVEKQADGKLAGYIRIRSKTQGIALSLGDKITLKQKG
uniref:Coatomer subunit beta n=1 Tax=Tetraselmis sp. GSL018 TaxID=582737 RepID=A0A061RS83_9CHLO|mmetsp:Transcript_38320/g.90880  ORF Transcript_38320/g.90880 Transcript_38320/m.90880 type:complete len:945 (-) Transcript_38320:210-3044(-)|eukprot:CAMPEP_0177613752 /NCGR_PEP_ID=MMETSP0419_2-20121207/22208_1 /TAXON_ID=582737 /ORGANISM="Tetraselmis sp., Strain GSL018" /LENGTH=944 /DNA_ID=CAMNT_0019110601 /DNA_START=279 /DNA_END=3113 /DNA_ORIENTATION=-